MSVRGMRRIVIGRAIALETLDVLQEQGEQGYEAIVLWLARFVGEDAIVKRTWVPRQTATRTEHGLHLRVGGDELDRLNQEIYRSGETLIAQLHTHPSLAYHSELDDGKPIVTEDGAFSIVVPFFGFVSLPDLTACAVYRIEEGEFARLAPSEVAGLFHLRP
jgi:hypothetical protein